VPPIENDTQPHTGTCAFQVVYTPVFIYLTVTFVILCRRCCRGLRVASALFRLYFLYGLLCHYAAVWFCLLFWMRCASPLPYCAPCWFVPHCRVYRCAGFGQDADDLVTSLNTMIGSSYAHLRSCGSVRCWFAFCPPSFRCCAVPGCAVYSGRFLQVLLVAVACVVHLFLLFELRANALRAFAPFLHSTALCDRAVCRTRLRILVQDGALLRGCSAFFRRMRFLTPFRVWTSFPPLWRVVLVMIDRLLRLFYRLFTARACPHWRTFATRYSRRVFLLRRIVLRTYVFVHVRVTAGWFELPWFYHTGIVVLSGLCYYYLAYAGCSAVVLRRVLVRLFGSARGV